MFRVLKERSYEIVKMFINQIAIAIFGIALSIATGSKSTSTDLTGYQPATLQIITSVFAVLFYLFLIFTMMREIGAKDASRFKHGETGISRLTGFYMGIAASSVNFLLAIFITLGTVFSAIPFFSKLGGISATIALLIEGMYTGLLAIRVNDIPLNSLWFMWFLIMIPMILTSTLGYLAGIHEFHLFKTFSGQKRE